jgi:serine protease Do
MTKKRKIILITLACTLALVLFFPLLKFNFEYYRDTWVDVYSSIRRSVTTFFSKFKKSKYSGPETTVGQEITPEESVVINAVDKVSPSVVSIVVETKTINFFTGVSTSSQQGIGTGFIVDKNGLIITSSHVVDATNSKYFVVLKDGTSYPVDKVHLDMISDVAILEITAKDLPVVEFGDSDTLKVGQKAIAIGNALGRYSNTVTTGVISGVARQVHAASSFTGQSKVFEDVIQTDAALNPGNSGGPLVNSSGQVIGINVATTEGAENIGFAIPINDVKPLLGSFIKNGEIVRPFLGVSYDVITSELAALNKIPAGALVSSVVKGSPAEKAGLQRGDTIKSVDGKEITVQESLSRIILSRGVGDRVKLLVDRNGKELVIYAVLALTPGSL